MQIQFRDRYSAGALPRGRGGDLTRISSYNPARRSPSPAERRSGVLGWYLDLHTVLPGDDEELRIVGRTGRELGHLLDKPLK
jgi:hypothetical protein